uniref:Uncharacterized protein n=1 Tax=Marseillevirus sp. TaxID=2809551 RepID=A0AA96IYV7_9VIRU|nr:hypothetical protein MarFTMF_418 [Marseillevirus sp.]
MEPITPKKLEALREQVGILSERLDFLRLEYDLCEKRQERKKLSKEVDETTQELDSLTCELLVAEEAIEQEVSSGVWENAPERADNFYREIPKQEHPEDPRDVEQELQHVQQGWLGMLIINAKGDVYRLMFIADDYIRVEKQRFLFDPVRWVSVDNRQLTFDRETLWRPLTPSEIFYPRVQYNAVQDTRKDGMNPFWIGKTIRNNFTGEKFEFLSRKNGVCMLKRGGKIRVEPEDSNFWSLAPPEEGKIQPSWIGKLVRDEHQRIYRVMSKHQEVGAWKVCLVEYTSSGLPIEGSPRYIPEDSTGWTLFEEVENGRIKPEWVGKNVQDEEGRVYEVIAYEHNEFALHEINSPSWNDRYVADCSFGWKLVPVQKKDKGKEKVY